MTASPTSRAGLARKSERLLLLRPWLVLALALLGGWLAAASWLMAERQALHRAEESRLQALVQSLDSILSQQLLAVDAALRALSAAAEPPSPGLLASLAQTMPGVQSLSLIDAQGRVGQSSSAALLAQPWPEPALLERARAQPDAQRLFLSPPSRQADGTLLLRLSRQRVDAAGRFAGLVSATLSPAFFELVLDAAQPSAQTFSALSHSQGLLFALMPGDPVWQGRNLLAQPDSVLARHLGSGGNAGLYRMKAHLSGDERLVATRTVLPPGLRQDQALVVAVGHAVAGLEAPWRRQRQAVLGVGLGLSLASVLGLALWCRRQRLLNRMRLTQRRHERDAATRMRLALDGAALGLWDWQLDSGRARYDERWCAMLGYRPDTIDGSVQAWRLRLHPDDSGVVQRALDDCLQGRRDEYRQEYRLRHRDGHWVWVHSSGRVTARAEDGRPLRMVGTHLDISQAREQALQLQEQAQATQAILDHMVDGVITIDAQGLVRSINPAACRMFGYADDELLGQSIGRLMGEPERGHHQRYIANYLAGGPARVIGHGRDVSGRRNDGSLFPMSLAVSRIERHGETLFIGLTRDITERKKAEAAIERLAFYDELTGLPNRRLLLDRLNQSLAGSRRKRRHGAVIFIDMDNFKSLNDTLGHGMGDRLLQAVAQRLGAALRSEDTVARWGGDEFVVLLQDLGAEREQALRHAEAAAEKLLRVLGQPYQLDDHAHHSTPSIGIVLWGDGETSSEELLKHADHAMYQAKAAGRNQLSFFDPVTQAALAERALLEAELREAIAARTLQLHYQPQVDRAGQLLGAELLLRWHHAERGWVSPADFIPLAEQTGLILPLGEQVLQQACEQLGRWARDPQLAGLTLAVNLSAHQFRQKGFLSLMQQLLARNEVPAGRLKIELTESTLLEDVDAAISLMRQLRALGLSFSLDDFGTGYSSLAYLKLLPLQQLKIDQSFVRDLLTEPNARAIALAIIQLGASLGLEVIAEGVETEAQREELAGQGCHAFQGWLFSRALPVAGFETWARRWIAGAAPGAMAQGPAPAPRPAMAAA